MAMKLTTGILAIAMMAGAAAAQSPDAIDNARSTAKTLQQTQANPAPKAAAPVAAKPAPGAPAPAVKPAAIPGSKPVAAAKPASTSSHNQLQRVNVVPAADGVQIEISSTQAVTPQVTKLTSPARLLVELPETVVATAQNKIPVGSAGVKAVRIGMDGKTPPTTSVVVDLEQPLSYELTPGAAGKVILTLHSQGGAPSVAKSTPAPAKTAPAKASAPATQSQAAAKPAPASTKVAAVKETATKPVAQASKPEPKQPAKAAAPVTAKAAAPAKTSAPAVSAPSAATQTATAPKAPKPEEKKWAMNGKRDPFFSPVVQTNGSGCSTGKKCLEIGAINLRGVVKSDTGFIAVVTNNLNKAYFLRENDPVFNGYVVKITGDSVVFQETIQDKLGKPFTREVVKRIFTPAV
jgi:AMIN domain-containing protein